MIESEKEIFEREWNKMLSGEVYDAVNPRFIEMLMTTRDKLWEFNNLRPYEMDKMKDILRGLLGSHGKNFHVNQPFRCDYGCNIHIGENFFANFNLTILDEAEVRIGDNCFIGPNVSIFTACHPLDAASRDTGVEWAEPVTIGDSVWIGGNATILPGVTIGDNVVIGAGSVVTRNIPYGVVVGGNPARIIKKV
ncbi:maltose O-acetyltransferase [Muribaculaceae bacterium]|nr:maltose O-acetyltransferase [Muribaculaceae bacterium]